jgi:murein DD-endopeptidase MepM/ murein hydrolase activator NlpD
MFKRTLHLNLRSGAALLAAVAAALATGEAPNARAAAQSTVSYGWPVKPFDRPHPILGAFSDRRTVFSAAPTVNGVLDGAGLFSFHEGVDISAPNGTAVYPVRDGRVTTASMEKSRERVVVDCPDGVEFEYWHIIPRVRVGDWVTTDRTVLGTILTPNGHVHLTEVRDGKPVNTLARGHLTPYSDTTAPTVQSSSFRSDSGGSAFATFVRGRLDLVAEAYDTPSLPVPGIWHDMPVTPRF